jgi:hypothetical protein
MFFCQSSLIYEPPYEPVPYLHVNFDRICVEIFFTPKQPKTLEIQGNSRLMINRKPVTDRSAAGFIAFKNVVFCDLFPFAIVQG